MPLSPRLDTSPRPTASSGSRRSTSVSRREHSRQPARSSASVTAIQITRRALPGVAPTSSLERRLGALTGVDAHDPADVEQWLAPYVARGEPQWSVDYIDVEGKTVLFVTVEAPEWGDSICTLQRGTDKAMPGAIYVRGNGKTEPANPQDVRRLTERARRAGARLQVGVEWRRSPRLVALADITRLADVFTNEEAERLRPNPPARPRGLEFAMGFDISFAQEMRSRNEYQAEYEQYCSSAAERFRLLIEKVLLESGVTQLELEVINPTDLNFPQTQVTLRLPSDTRAYFNTDALDEALSKVAPPTPWGKKTLAAGLALSPRYVPNLLPVIRPDGRNIELGAELVITLPPIDVRPGNRHELLPIEVVLPESYVGQTLEIAWRATSTGADGDADGTLEAAVADKPAVPEQPRESIEDA